MDSASVDLAKSSPPKRGAVAVIKRGSEYLLIKRAEGVIKGGFWCFPGGHLEPGETSAQAVTRELMEELDIEIEPKVMLGSIPIHDTNHILDIWLVDHVGRELCPNEDEIAEVRWVTVQQLKDIRPTLTSNDEVLRMLGN